MLAVGQEARLEIFERLGFDVRQQVVLVAEMGVERAAVHVGGGAQRLHGYLRDVVLAHEVDEGAREGALRVLHAAIGLSGFHGRLLRLYRSSIGHAGRIGAGR